MKYAYDNLRAAVLRQAVRDYKYVPKMRQEIIRFVKSDLFDLYSDNISRETFLEHLKKIAPF